MRRLDCVVQFLSVIVFQSMLGCAVQPETLAEPRVKVYVVEGTLMVGDRPAPFASLAFHPIGGSGMVECPVAITSFDGSYRLTTFASDDGAPAGDYVVTVVWPDPANVVDECECPDLAKHDLLRGLYSDRTTSSLRATVRPEENRISLNLVETRGDL